jgi:hypothetical protein
LLQKSMGGRGIKVLHGHIRKFKDDTL